MRAIHKVNIRKVEERGREGIENGRGRRAREEETNNTHKKKLCVVGFIWGIFYQEYSSTLRGLAMQVPV